jgi:S1/P1 Nuclease
MVGDVHQPLHATARFTSSQPNGDAGGNLVQIDCGGCPEINLHAFWDEVPGGGNKVDEAIAAARALPAADPRQAVVRDENIWIAERFEIAKSAVYRTPIGGGTVPSSLTDGYRGRRRSDRR